jgi:hypothetical protein
VIDVLLSFVARPVANSFYRQETCVIDHHRSIVMLVWKCGALFQLLITSLIPVMCDVFFPVPSSVLASAIGER